MGLDLAFLPFFGNDTASYSVIECGRCSELFDIITALEKQKGILLWEHAHGGVSRDDVPCENCHKTKYSDSHYGDVNDNPYGEKTKYVPVKDLLLLKDLEEISDNPRNVAVWAYLQHLPTNTKIGLWWH